MLLKPIIVTMLLSLVPFISTYCSALTLEDTTSLQRSETEDLPEQDLSLVAGAKPLAELVSQTPPMISAVMAGDYDYVELYNPGADPINLQGYQLIYRLGTDNRDQQMYTFIDDVMVPGRQYFLLGKTGDQLPTPPDVIFEQQMNVKTGGVGLFSPAGDLVDAVAWGKAPALFIEGQALPDMPSDQSFARLFDADRQDTNNNRIDFVPSPPNPKNSQQPTGLNQLTGLSVRLEAPDTVASGESFTYRLQASNHSKDSLTNLILRLPISIDLTLGVISDGGYQATDQILWVVPQLPAGETIFREVTVQAPYAYQQFRSEAYHAEADGLSRPVFGPTVVTNVRGGVIPIQIARTLDGVNVTIEGVATMYTGGYYAGSGNAKFYVQDETGGIQVQMFDEDGPVPTVTVGDQVRVSGLISTFRDSIQLVPGQLPDDVEIMAQTQTLAPQPIAFAELKEAHNHAGRYVSVSGQITRVEEFTYSYELDLLDEAGNSLFIYLDKLTGLTDDTITIGDRYAVAGIIEFYQGRWELKPRLSDDFARIYPEILLLEVSAPITVQPGDSVEYTLTARNFMQTPITNLIIQSAIPGRLIEIKENGVRSGDTISWEITMLEPQSTVQVQFSVVAQATEGWLVNGAYQALADHGIQAVIGNPHLTFVGENVPIWAIQGQGFKTPYPNQRLQTQGVVTAIFDPDEIPGFFIQEVETDTDPTTSAGLFIATAGFRPDFQLGDLVQVRGTVKEVSGQTQLILSQATLLATDTPLPEPVSVNPPANAAAAEVYFEALEGMLVSASGVAVSPTSRFGETAFVLADHQRDRIMRTGDTGLIIVMDDGSWQDSHSDLSTLPVAVTTGDLLEDIVGPLAYTFGQYKIEPLVWPVVTSGNFPKTPTLSELTDTTFSIAAFNVENFFDNKVPHPSSPPRPRRKQYLLKALKIANTIAAMGFPTIIGLSEVENIQVLEKVIEQPSLADYPYQAILVEGRDSRGIDVGYLVRSDQATILNYALRLDDGDLFTRGPLILEAKITTASGNLMLYTIVNHFVSLGAGFEATEPRRIKQAQWNLDLANEILSENPEAYIAILGDLNTFYDAPTINLLRANGFVHTFETLPPEARYTYIFQGASQVLDHVLVTQNLADLIESIHILHTNADFPPPIPGDDSPRRASDHDPVIIHFEGP